MTLIKNSKTEATKQGHGGSSSGLTHHHILPLKTYFMIFGILLVLTVITVGVSVLALPHPWSIIVAMVVAFIKATFVAAYFMHLKWDEPFNRLIFAGSLLFLGLFFFFTYADVLYRGHINQEERYDSAPPVPAFGHPKPAGEAPAPH